MPSRRSAPPDLYDVLHRLAEADGPPGREGAVRRLVEAEVRAAGMRPQISPLGSVYAERRSPNGARVLLAAHMDEVGFIVSHVDRDGIVWLHPAGVVRSEACAGAAVRFPHGLQAELGYAASPAAADGAPPRLLADLGAHSPGRRVAIGSMGVFASPWESGREVVRGKALDNRVGVALALRAARIRRRSAHSLLLAFTALGQVGQRAACAAATELRPDLVLTLGVLPVGDGRQPGATRARAGRGPAIVVRAGSYVADAWLTEVVTEAAVRGRLPHQLLVAVEERSGAEEMQAALAGIPTATVLVPVTGVGTPQQAVERRDLEAAEELIGRVLERPLRR